MSTVLPSSAFALEDLWPSGVAPEDLSRVDEQPARAMAAPKTVSFTRERKSGMLEFMVCASELLVWGDTIVWCLRNNYTFVALKLAWGEARRRECIPSDTRPTEQRSPRPISAQPEGRHVFWAKALLLAPYRSTAGYARRSRLASAQNPLPRMYSYFGDTTLAAR